MNTRHKLNRSGFFSVIGACLSAVAALNMALPSAQAAAIPGKAAPAFSEKDSNGKTRSLAEFKGRYVVLEWLNHDCPFVKKHYNSGNMQKLQRDTRKQGVVWLSVNSSAAGKQGHHNGAETNKLTQQKKAAPSAVLLDGDGNMGRAYGAKTSPHMIVINPQGVVIYNGAIDDKPTTDVADVKGARNYVTAALAQARKGQKVSVSRTQPYGCAVKY
jgi:peroxiredoxin